MIDVAKCVGMPNTAGKWHPAAADRRRQPTENYQISVDFVTTNAKFSSRGPVFFCEHQTIPTNCVHLEGTVQISELGVHDYREDTT